MAMANRVHLDIQARGYEQIHNYGPMAVNTDHDCSVMLPSLRSMA